MFRRVALASACAALLAGCTGRGPARQPTPAGTPPAGSTAAALVTPGSACSPARPVASGDASSTIESGGLTRSYILHVPPAYDGSRALPLVLAFHPYAGTAAFLNAYAKLPAAADAGGFILVSPNGAGSPQQWNTAKYTAAADDVTFVRDLLAKLDGQLCIDRDRVYAEGYSTGGGMAELIACEMPDRIAAVGLVASTYVGCPAATPVIAFHGTYDPLVPFGGADQSPTGAAGDLPPIRKELSDWAKRLGCDGLPTITRPAPDIELSTYHNCPKGDGEALLYAVLGGGHTWPGAAADLKDAGPTSHDFDATTTIWQFFVRHAHTT